MNRFKPLKTKKTSDFAVEAIWELIHSGELKPGEKLPPERELSERFGISMTSLREALQKLESYGHITKKRGKGGGSIILDVTENPGLELAAQKLMLQKVSIEQINQAAIKILPILYELAMEKMTEKQLDKLKEISRKQREDFDKHKGSVLGWKFSIEVARISGNPIFENILEFMMLLLMQKEFSLGIDDIGSSDMVIEYNRCAVELNEQLCRAFEMKNMKMAGKAVSAMNRALLNFKNIEDET